MAKLNIWVSCNCLSIKKYNDLINTIQSIIKQQQVELVLSIHTNQKLDSLFDLVIASRINFAIIEQPLALTELEHLEELRFCHKLNNDSWITFIGISDTQQLTMGKTIKYENLCNFFDNNQIVSDVWPDKLQNHFIKIIPINA